MPESKALIRRLVWTLSAAAVSVLATPAAWSQGSGQAVDKEYTAKIKEYLQDPRITTELVDHLPASSTVPMIALSAVDSDQEA